MTSLNQVSKEIMYSKVYYPAKWEDLFSKEKILSNPTNKNKASKFNFFPLL